MSLAFIEVLTILYKYFARGIRGSVLVAPERLAFNRLREASTAFVGGNALELVLDDKIATTDTVLLVKVQKPLRGEPDTTCPHQVGVNSWFVPRLQSVPMGCGQLASGVVAALTLANLYFLRYSSGHTLGVYLPRQRRVQVVFEL